jgi:hypothetical protein
MSSDSGKIPKTNDTFTSVNNTKETIPFLLDSLKAVAGSEALKILIGAMLVKVVSKVEPKLKKALKKQFNQANSNDPLPTAEVEMEVKTIDQNKKLAISPNDVEKGGNLLYGDTSENNCERNMREAIEIGDTEVNCNNITVKYDSNTDKFKIKPLAVAGAITIGAFFSKFIDDTKLIDSEEIVGNVMDKLFGTLSKAQGKTQEQVLDELVVEKMLEQVLNDDDSFEISPEDYAALQLQAEQLSKGVVTYDTNCNIVQGIIPQGISCNTMVTELSMNSLQDLMSKISGSTDPFAVGNAIETAFDESLSDSDVNDENKQTLKDNLFDKIINTLTVKLLKSVMTAPQVRMLMGIASSIENQGQVMLSSAKEDIKRWKICIKCMAKEIIMIIAAFIFSLVVQHLIKLIKPEAKKRIKEKINGYTNTVKGLVGVSKMTEAVT